MNKLLKHWSNMFGSRIPLVFQALEKELEEKDAEIEWLKAENAVLREQHSSHVDTDISIGD